MGFDDEDEGQQQPKKRSTSQSRFHDRIATFRLFNVPVIFHHFWWFTHNVIAHPLIGVLPFFKWPFTFHDYTSNRINAQNYHTYLGKLVARNRARMREEARR